MTEYWSWWQGGLALGGLTILFRVLMHRPLGVSGSWKIITGSRQERANEQLANAFAQDTGAMNQALMEATLAQFGSDALNKQIAADLPQQESGEHHTTPTTTFGQHATFLLFIFIGGLLSALYTGSFSIDLELSEMLTTLSHGLVQSWLYLLLGGMMVGFGTQMAAGCTSGHGLSGCAQLSSTSLVATGIFFGGAVITAMFFSLAI